MTKPIEKPKKPKVFRGMSEVAVKIEQPPDNIGEAPEHELFKDDKGDVRIETCVLCGAASGQRQSDLVSFAVGGKEEHGSSAVSRTTGRPAEVLRQGSGIKVDGTAGDGLTISTYI